MTILVLFSGADGWSEGLKTLGPHRTIGLEVDRDACLTATAAGHPTVRADITAYPTGPFVGNVDGLIASPPCTDWSTAGKQRRWDGDSGRLVLEVPRWVGALAPRWVACEQVPPALEVWERFAHDFLELGYRTWVGILNAADYGVPQTRRRAFLLASMDFQPGPPTPSHAREPGVALFGQRAPWVSMADALGWSDGRVGFPRRDDIGDSLDGYGTRDTRDVGEPAFNLTEKARSWSVRTGANTMKHSRDPDEIESYERPISQPAPTVDAKAGSAWTLISGQSVTGVGRAERATDEPALTVGSRADQWTIDRRQNGAPIVTAAAPSPTMTGTAIGKGVWDVRDPDGDPVKITIEDALIVQSFRPDYPLHGTRTSQFRQVGNAVPPRLAAAVLAQFAQVQPVTSSSATNTSGR